MAGDHRKPKSFNLRGKQEKAGDVCTLAFDGAVNGQGGFMADSSLYIYLIAAHDKKPRGPRPLN